ncbi:BTB/POZ domain-containing protein 9-like protein [Dinothrombium tinctorium]|uniref:BTB/POZ domain-containing protein 9-like protein n=1 Tax=Dinothrombium tinctorium TaxID=1965070 RepID=A0A3S3P7X1_9ACAR|nr:BTB/POZ domain-containing protein 9-like protein [Dinothrombium tinctorium]
MTNYCVFVVEGENVPFEKSVLTAKCAYFKDYFDKSANTFEIKVDSTKRALESFLEFLRNDHIIKDLKAADLNELIDLCHKFKYKTLIEYIVDTNCLTLTNVAKVYTFANRFDLFDISQKCLDFIDENAQKLMENIEIFKSFPLRLVYDVIDRDTFEVPELEIFKAVVELKKANRYDVSLLLKKIRLNLINKDEFYDYVLPTKIFNDNDYFIACKTKKFNSRSKDGFYDALNESKADEDCALTTESFHSSPCCAKLVEIFSKIDIKTWEKLLHLPQVVDAKNSNIMTAKNESAQFLPIHNGEVEPCEVKAIHSVLNRDWIVIEATSFYRCVADENIVFEFQDIHHINYIAFKFTAENYYYKSYSVFAGLTKNKLQWIHTSGEEAIYWGWQNVFFKPIQAKYVQIEFPKSLRTEIDLKSFKFELNSSLKFNRMDFIMNAKKSWAQKFNALKRFFPETNEDEVYALQHPCYVSQLQFRAKSINASSDIRIETKENTLSSWEECEDIDFTYEVFDSDDGYKIYTFKFRLRLVSFIRIPPKLFKPSVNMIVCSSE